MLRVRRKFVDAALMTVVGATIVAVATTIHNPGLS